MTAGNENISSEPISEGMLYGPFPLPELDPEQPLTAKWLMEEAKGSLKLYQLYRLHEQLLNDNAESRIATDVFDKNNARLRTEIRKLKGSFIREDFRRPKSERTWLSPDDL